jgi:hypothetical protein
VAGFISEWWPASNRNPGRLQIGIPGRLASEFASAFHKTEALFCASPLPALAIANPGKNIVGDSTERNHAVWVSSVTRDHLTGAPTNGHYRRDATDVRQEGYFASCKSECSAKINSERPAASVEL